MRSRTLRTCRSGSTSILPCVGTPDRSLWSHSELVWVNAFVQSYQCSGWPGIPGALTDVKRSHTVPSGRSDKILGHCHSHRAQDHVIFAARTHGLITTRAVPQHLLSRLLSPRDKRALGPNLTEPPLARLKSLSPQERKYYVKSGNYQQLII